MTLQRKYGVGLLLCVAVVLLDGGYYYQRTQPTAVQKPSQRTVKKSRAKVTHQKATQKSSVIAPVRKTASEPLTFDSQQLTANAGQVGYGIYYLKNQRASYSNQNQPLIAASVIKIFIMGYLYQQMAQKQLAADQVVGDSTVTALITAMIQYSDNNATNQLIDYVGMPKINQYLQEQGYQQTKLERRMLDNAARAQGLENVTSVTDTVNFLKQLYQDQTRYPANQMLAILKGQQVRTKIPSQLPAGTVVANKTGELADVENDIGIVYRTDNPYIIVVLTNQVSNTSAERQAIGQLSLAAFQMENTEE
ncbi:serine hydrolase [Latilactobacillus fuchuensis]|uniref:serine hydrolase n=1 Tax=Latilactobacillus fuchuensis TaxID=164393 RepID=UPI0020C74A27|nr:serine hydrolase [Latilactobacillus fuchuensis]MCP8857016.1 class A beta-lactamase-related serine hydrolase [Latilactobacillus fuchuensis]